MMKHRTINRLIPQARRLSSAVSAQYDNNILYTYDRFPIEIVSGQGCYFQDSLGQNYLDFGSGIAVNALGYNHPMWVKAVQEQAAKLCHVSNLYYTKEQGELGRQLVETSIFDKAFFCNSGAEANEAALKFARRYSRNVHKSDTKTVVVGFGGSFHGRTLGSLSITSNAKYREPFEPLLPKAHFAKFNCSQCLPDHIDENTCGVLVEPIQGEGGVNPATKQFLRDLQQRCRDVGALFMVDEVQCGLGRTGKLWAHELYDLEPDVMTVAKPLAGGLPIGAVLLKDGVAQHIKPGDHGTTFGGNALICSVASKVLDFVNDPAFLQHVTDMGHVLREEIRTHIEPLHVTKDVRHMGGLICGVELTGPVATILKVCRERGVLFLNAGPNTIRMLPPLVISESEIKSAISILTQAIMESEMLNV